MPKRSERLASFGHSAGQDIPCTPAQTPDGLGLKSRYNQSPAVCPSYRQPEFLDWLRRYIADHRIRAIVPSEGFLLAIRPAFTEFATLLPFSDREEILYRGLSKADVYRTLASAGQGAKSHLPPSMCLQPSDPDVSESDLIHLGFPLFLKVDGCHSRSGEPGLVIRVRTAAEAADVLVTLRNRFDRVLVQGFVAGRGVGAFFIAWDGAILADFQHRRIHEVPHTGGVSSLRGSYQNPAVRDDARAKLQALSWQGVGMLEYRLDDATGRLHFIEFNGRFWGSLHLALFARVDFPALLLDAFHGHARSSDGYRLGVRCRNTFPQEVQYVWSRLKDRRLGLTTRAWSVVEFVLLSLDPRVYNDLLYPGDRGLWFIAFGRSITQWLGGLSRRLSQRKDRDA